MHERLRLPPVRPASARPRGRRARVRAGRAAPPRRGGRARTRTRPSLGAKLDSTAVLPLASSCIAAATEIGRCRRVIATKDGDLRQPDARSADSEFPRAARLRRTAIAPAPPRSGRASPAAALAARGPWGRGWSGSNASSVDSASLAGRGPIASATAARAELDASGRASAPGVQKRPLLSLGPFLEAAAHVGDAIAERTPTRGRGRRHLPRLRAAAAPPRAHRSNSSAEHSPLCTRICAATVRASAAPTSSPSSVSPACGRVGDLDRHARVSAHSQRHSTRSSSRWTSSRSGRVSASARSSSARGGAHVAASEGAPAGGGEPLARGVRPARRPA